jgi:CheY-like chemotaxis protein
MTASFVVCQECGDSSAAVEWGFVLLARHGWSAQLADPGAEPLWRCPSCNAREATAEPFGLEDDLEQAGRRLRVLLVDDQVLVLRATAGMLRELDVVTASNANEALARLEEGSHFDAMVSDVSMPGMNGAELYLRVRARFPHLADRFLLLSGDGYGASLLCSALGRREGVARMPKILDKPVPRDLLVREIEQIGRHLPSSGTFSIGEPYQTTVAKAK